MDGDVAESQFGAGRGGLGPAGELVAFVVLHAGNMRPAVVSAGLQDIHLVVGLGTLLGGVERAVRAEIDTLRIAVAVRKDVAEHAVQLRVVSRDAAVEVDGFLTTETDEKIREFSEKKPS